jgi:hypothetical protein
MWNLFHSVLHIEDTSKQLSSGRGVADCRLRLSAAKLGARVGGVQAIGGNTKQFDLAAQNDEDAVMQISRFQNNLVCLRIALLADSANPAS